MKATAGRRRHLVTFQARDTGRNDTGQPKKTWSTFATAWVRIESVQGSEKFAQGQFSPEVTHVVTALPIDVDGLTPMHRVLTDEGMILDIQYINSTERRMDGEVMMTCKQRIGAAGDLDVG
jgi:SPP1 family predicted phage head-tail adaptor